MAKSRIRPRYLRDAALSSSRHRWQLDKLMIAVGRLGDQVDIRCRFKKTMSE